MADTHTNTHTHTLIQPKVRDLRCKSNC